MKKSTIIGIVVIAAFMALGAGAFKGAATRYVSFGEARKSPSVVQVKGSVDVKSIRVDRKSYALSFDLTDEAGDRLPVVYPGSEPPSFREAPSVVAVGRYNGSALEAERLLVKCPSKYEGQGSEHPEGAPTR